MAGLKAFVTGGTGFIGQRLVARLLEDGWDVRALVLPNERNRMRDRPALDICVGDIRSPESLRGTMDDRDAVFHLAALLEPWTRDPKNLVAVNVAGTRNLMEEALRAAVSRVVFTSSMSGIGVQPGSMMGEDSPPGRVFHPYEESKAAAERLVSKYVEQRGLPAITLIPSVVLGPGDAHNTGKFLLSFLRGEFPGTFAEDSLIPVVDVNDVVQAQLLAYARGRVGEHYIISGENVTWGELLRIASAASGTPMPSRHIRSRSVWLASRMGELLARVTRSSPRLPAWIADFLSTGASVDNTKSIRELGLAYRPIKDSIADTIDWFRRERMIGSVGVPPAAPLARMPIENPITREDSAGDSGIPDAPRKAHKVRPPKSPEGPT